MNLKKSYRKKILLKKNQKTVDKKIRISKNPKFSIFLSQNFEKNRKTSEKNSNFFFEKYFLSTFFWFFSTRFFFRLYFLKVYLLVKENRYRTIWNIHFSILKSPIPGVIPWLLRNGEDSSCMASIGGFGLPISIPEPSRNCPSDPGSR